MKDQRILLVGCGDIGIALGAKLFDKGASVWGLRRKTSALPSFIQPVQGDVTDPDSLKSLNNLSFDYVVVTLTPASYSDEGYQRVYVQGFDNVLSVLREQSFSGHLVLVSSTSVYHQQDGQWVDESSPTQPVTFAGRRLLQAEQLLDEFSNTSTIVRFAGIYGPGRRRLIDQVLARKGVAEKPAMYTNRIHKDDCVGFLFHLLDRHYRGEPLERLYIGVDSEPATLHSVKIWLAEQLGINPEVMSHTVANRSGNKRCSNRRMLACGYRLLYPDYRQGYAELVKNEI